MATAFSNTAMPSSSATPTVDESAVFARVTEGLLAIGASPVARYLYDPSFTQNASSSSTVTLSSLPAPAHKSEHIIPKAVARLHQACQTTFGDTRALKFEFEDDDTTHGKRCTVTITRPNGVSRTFTSPITYGRKYDAKASASSIAIENGAIEFIMTSNSDGSPMGSELPSTPLEMDETVKTIEQCALEWGKGRIKPFWLKINEPRFGRTQGCALRIRLGPRNTRVYSVNTIYNTPAEAKKACAEAALAEGVIDYIKSWSPSSTDITAEETEAPIGLQQFFDSLPQPFPEPVSGKSAMDINGPAWLNTTIQSARGGKIVPNFVWTVDPRHGFHGCLLRLERPGEVRSYLVDARFLKRMEAKAAVCLLAMSEGVGDYIRGVGRAVEDKLTRPMRKHASDVLLPILLTEYRRVRGSGIQPTFEFEQDLDACGATLLIELAPKPSAQQVQRYSVPAEYRSRNDAKLAVVLHAAAQGAIEFLHFGGKPPPPGYVPNYTQQEYLSVNRKRKWDVGGGADMSSGEWSPDAYSGSASNSGWSSKKPRVGGGFQGDFIGKVPHVQGAGHGLRHCGQFGPGGGFQHDSKPVWNGHQKKPQVWTGNRGPGFGAVGPVAGGAGQHKLGPRSIGAPQSVQSVAHIPAPYPGFSMQSQHQLQPHPQSQQPVLSPSPPAYAAGGAVAGVPPFQAGYYNAQLPSVQAPYQALGGLMQPAPGGVAYPYFQPHVPAAVTPASVQYPTQNPYGSVQSYPAAYYPPPVPAPGAPNPPALNRAPGHLVPTPTAHYFGAPSPSPGVLSTHPAAPIVNAPSVGYGYQLSPGSHQAAPSAVMPVPPPSVPPPPPPSNPAPPLPQPSKSAPNSHAKQPTPLSSGSGDGKKGSRLSLPIEATPQTSVTALNDYCMKNNKPTPQWSHEIVKSEREPRYKVWIVIGRMKFELPVTFTSLCQGQEKIAKKVLAQLQVEMGGKAAAGAKS